MRFVRWTWLLSPLVLSLAGCAGFWQNPTTSTSFTLSSSPTSLSVSPGSSGTSTITVTPSSSFTGTVALACSVTTAPSGASNPATCSLSASSVLITSTTAETATLTVATASGTTAGAYDITVTGTSGSTSETTSVCADVSTSSATCSPAAGASGVFYVLNQTKDQVVAISISSSGTLTTIGSASLAAAPLAIAVAPNGKFLYVSTAGGIFLYAIGSTGGLTLENNGVAISSDFATTMQVDATNSWLVDAISGSSQLAAIAINSSTGALATSGESEQFLSGGLPATTPTQLAISPNDSSSCTACYVFVGMDSGGTEIVAFNPANGNPFGGTGHINLVSSAGGANTVAVDPTNRLLYIGESDALPSATQSGGLRAFTIASNGVTELTSAGSPYSVGGTGPSSILPSSNGSYVYVANRSISGSSADNITGFSVATSGLTSIGTVAAGPTGLLSLAEDSTGSYLLAADSAGNPDLQVYTMSSGTLTSTLTATTGTDPVGAIAIAAMP